MTAIAIAERDGPRISCPNYGQSPEDGGVGAILVLVNRDDFGNNVNFKAEQVDGKKIKSDTWYKLVDGKFTEVI